MQFGKRVVGIRKEALKMGFDVIVEYDQRAPIT